MLRHIGTEAPGHLEVSATLARMHRQPARIDREPADADPPITVRGGRADSPAFSPEAMKVDGD